MSGDTQMDFGFGTDEGWEMGELCDGWMKVLGEEFEAGYMEELRDFLSGEANDGKIIYPRGEAVFSAMNLVGFDDVKVVILGQDPYHGAGQAHGLSFSVGKGVKIPPSLRNIYKEIVGDLGEGEFLDGDLSGWAEQGVLLLNTTLTVEEGKAGSHAGRGWEKFTDAVIGALNDGREGLVFMLWGAHAQKKGGKIDEERHLVLRSVHPSPLSAYRGFLGCGHFSKANGYLVDGGGSGIDWV